MGVDKPFTTVVGKPTEHNSHPDTPMETYYRIETSHSFNPPSRRLHISPEQPLVNRFRPNCTTAAYGGPVQENNIAGPYASYPTVDTSSVPFSEPVPGHLQSSLPVPSQGGVFPRDYHDGFGVGVDRSLDGEFAENVLPFYPRLTPVSVAVLSPFGYSSVLARLRRYASDQLDCRFRMFFDNYEQLEDSQNRHRLWQWTDCLLILGFENNTVSTELFRSICAFADLGGSVIYLGRICEELQEHARFIGCSSFVPTDWEGEYLISSTGRAETEADIQITRGVETFVSGTHFDLPGSLSRDCRIHFSGRADHRVEPVAWTRTYGDGRLFYTTLGQTPDWLNSNFQQLLVNAIKWSTVR